MDTRRGDVARMISQHIDSNEQLTRSGVEIMQMIAALEGVTLSRESKTAAAVITGAEQAYDAAFDKFDLRTARVRGDAILRVLKGQEVDESLIDPSVKKSLIVASDNLNEQAFGTLVHLTEAQIGSLRQREDDVSVAEIENISRDKGGSTVLLFALEANPTMDEKRKKCYQELGYLVQLLDDVLDKDEDRQAGIRTLATELPSAETVAKIKQQVDYVKQLFRGEYKEDALAPLFGYIDKTVAKAGVV